MHETLLLHLERKFLHTYRRDTKGKLTSCERISSIYQPKAYIYEWSASTCNIFMLSKNENYSLSLIKDVYKVYYTRRYYNMDMLDKIQKENIFSSYLVSSSLIKYCIKICKLSHGDIVYTKPRKMSSWYSSHWYRVTSKTWRRSQCLCVLHRMWFSVISNGFIQRKKNLFKIGTRDVVAKFIFQGLFYFVLYETIRGHP